MRIPDYAGRLKGILDRTCDRFYLLTLPPQEALKIDHAAAFCGVPWPWPLDFVNRWRWLQIGKRGAETFEFRSANSCRWRIEMKKMRKQMAAKLGISIKTLRGWVNDLWLLGPANTYLMTKGFPLASQGNGLASNPCFWE
jgi:hypothetical protein